MKRRTDAEAHADDEPPPPVFDIFAGIKKESLPSPAPLPNLQGDDPSAALSPGTATSSAAPGTNRLEKPFLNQLAEKHPRLFLYATIAIAALAAGILIGIKVTEKK